MINPETIKFLLIRLAIIIAVLAIILFFLYRFSEKKEKSSTTEESTGMEGLGVVKGKKFTGNGIVPVDIKKTIDGKIQGIEIDGHDMTDQILYSPYRSVNVELTGGQEGFREGMPTLVHPGDEPQQKNYKKKIHGGYHKINVGCKRRKWGFGRCLEYKYWKIPKPPREVDDTDAYNASNEDWGEKKDTYEEEGNEFLDGQTAEIDGELTKMDFQNMEGMAIIEDERNLRNEEAKKNNAVDKHINGESSMSEIKKKEEVTKDFFEKYPKFPKTRKNDINAKMAEGKRKLTMLSDKKNTAHRDFIGWKNTCRQNKSENIEIMDENNVEATSTGGKFVLDKCGFQNIKEFFSNLLTPFQEGFGEKDCNLKDIEEKSFSYLTKKGFKVTTSGFSNKHEDVGSTDTPGVPRIIGCGFYCDGTNGCSRKMKSVISRLERGRNYKISIWGWETKDNSGKHINHEPVEFDILANGEKMNEDPINHITNKLPKDPSAKYKGTLVAPLVVKVITAKEDTEPPPNNNKPANGWGKIEITWTVLENSYCVFGTNCKGSNKNEDNHGNVPYSNIQITEMEMNK